MHHRRARIPSEIDLQYRVAERLVFKNCAMPLAGGCATAWSVRRQLRFTCWSFLGRRNSHLRDVWHDRGHRRDARQPTGGTRLGTVGQAIPPMQCRIAEDGEVLLRGPWVFRGYFRTKRPRPASFRHPAPRTAAMGPGCTPAISARWMAMATCDHRPQEAPHHHLRREKLGAGKHRSGDQVRLIR